MYCEQLHNVLLESLSVYLYFALFFARQLTLFVFLVPDAKKGDVEETHKMDKIMNSQQGDGDQRPLYKESVASATDSRIPKLEDVRNENARVLNHVNEKVKMAAWSKGNNKNATYGYPNHLMFIKEEGTSRRTNSLGKWSNLQFRKDHKSYYNYFIISLCISFIFGLALGVFLMGSTQRIVRVTTAVPRIVGVNGTVQEGLTRTLNSYNEMDRDENISQLKSKKSKHLKVDGRFSSVSFTGDNDKGNHKYKKDVYPKGMTEDMKDILKDNKNGHHAHVINTAVAKNKSIMYVPDKQTVLYENIYWGEEIEQSLPQGYGSKASDIWEKYMDQAEVIKMEIGCGRMQNRLVTFSDGLQACVRYRQNTDQIQGEIFSFYVAKLLNLTNLAPSVIKIVDLKDDLWKNVANDVAVAQWNLNRAVVLTQYIPSLESANIPDIFKPSSRHLNKYDVYKLSLKENDTVSKADALLDRLKLKDFKKAMEKNEVADFDHLEFNLSKKTIESFVELAQWSDLIVFDYLTANLDRIVNNLFNFQWNINIMDGPAHNLARKVDSGLLLFLDNESGLLHGYRLLKKYNFYHSLMLDNLCVFRKSTVDNLKKLFSSKDIGVKLNDIFHRKNDAVIRDILPPLPEKNAKILHERIGKVLSQVTKCEQNFSLR